MKIGYRAYGRASLAYGLKLCMNAVKERDGIEFVSISKYNWRDCDILLFSLYWWQHIYDHMQFLAQAGIDASKRKPLIVIGGFQSYNFHALGNTYHYACTGDGEEWLPKFLWHLKQGKDPSEIPGTTWPGNTNPVEWQNVPYMPIEIVEPGQRVSRIEIARGCRYSCKFCALTYLKQYRESDYNDVTRLIKSAKEKTIALFAPDRTSHSRFQDFQDFATAHGKSDLASDVRLDTLRESDQVPVYVRIGIEGISYRLRKAVGKNFTDDMIFETFNETIDRKTSKSGRRGIRIYLILDLPGEDETDYEAFEALLFRLNEMPHAEQLVLFTLPNTFLPSPLTPMQYGEARIFRPVSQLFKGAMRGGKAPWRFMVAEQQTIWGPHQRLMSLIASRGDDDAEGLVRDIVMNKRLRKMLQTGSSHDRAEKLLKWAERNHGYDYDRLCGRKPIGYRFPWSNVGTHRNMYGIERSWLSYCRTVGLDPNDTQVGKYESNYVTQAEVA